ncbi:MAG TPA: AAA family ATPase [Methylocella sp.]|jgi:putative DNA primase/helicase
MNGPPFSSDPFYEPPGVSIDPTKLNGNGKHAAVTLVVDMESLEMESIEWLWERWIARGKFHLIAGAPEAGKTTLALSIGAAISSASYWPDGTKAPAGNVLIWTAEDGIADTIKPRLVQMGADLSRIKVVAGQRGPDGKTRPFNPATDMPSLAEAANAIPGGVSLLIIDPVVAAIGTKTNSHNNAETRNSLQPVLDFAEATNCAVLGITHFTKGTAGKDPVERITGSVAFGALARIVLIASKNAASNQSEAPRILVRAKSNIGPSGGGFGYDIIAAPLYERPDIIATRIAWQESIEGSARELLAEAEGEEPGEGLSKQDQAKRFLKTALSSGERPQKDIETEAKQGGISWGTLKRASEGCDITKRKDGLTGGWLWRLREPGGK